MAFWLLPNTLGAIATATGTNAVPGVASGYSANDVLTGPRSSRVRFQAYLGARNFVAYINAASFSFTHIAIARADWMITATGARVRPLETTLDSPLSNSIIAGFDFNPLTAANLIGIRSQDLVMAAPGTNRYGGGFQWTSTASEAQQFSKLYVSNGFQFGIEPDLGSLSITPLSNAQTFQDYIPQRGTQPYSVEARISLAFRGITSAKLAAFRALPKLQEWPMFLFDDNGSIFQWRLEHALVEGWTETLVAQDLWDVEISFLRLRHYP